MKMEEIPEMNEIRQMAENGNVRDALNLAKKVYSKKPSEKLQKKIKKMEKFLQEYGDENSSDDEDDMFHVGNGFYLYHKLYKRLYEYQRDGIKWMWGLHKKGKGGILGDDMGLGKTIQVISFLSGMFDMEKLRTVLVVLPVSLIANWQKEFEEWAPGIHVAEFHGNKNQREKHLHRVQRRGGVLLTTYGLVCANSEVFGNLDGRPFVWDYTFLDEAHKIKNPTKTTKALHGVPSKQRIALSGTPLQNNLRELWALFDFVHFGALLGSARTFKLEYENPITRAREKNATAGQRNLGNRMSASLQKLIDPYFLRRTKDFALNQVPNDDKENVAVCRPKQLPTKNDIIVWLYLTPVQQTIYGDFLNLEEVKQVLMTKKSPLVQLTVLKKICDHPRLLSRRACNSLGLDGSGCILDDEAAEACVADGNLHLVSSETLLEESNKVSFTLKLVIELRQQGHRCLIFSHSRRMLNILQKLLTENGFKFLRVDGTITDLREREKRIRLFQTNNSYTLFLLTTQVGGVGLTLTGADRVIIIDPSWNPATDAQAVDRAYRIGQDKPVVVYRLITVSTIEEKIYRRQIFKDSIIRQTTGDTHDPFRYFTFEELRELFTYTEPRYSHTQKQLEKMHAHQRKATDYIQSHFDFLHTLDIFGISDHDLMFNCKEEEEAIVDEHDEMYIQTTVMKAQERVKQETQLVQQMNDGSNPLQYMSYTQNWTKTPFRSDLADVLKDKTKWTASDIDLEDDLQILEASHFSSPSATISKPVMVDSGNSQDSSDVYHISDESIKQLSISNSPSTRRVGIQSPLVVAHQQSNQKDVPYLSSSIASPNATMSKKRASSLTKNASLLSQNTSIVSRNTTISSHNASLSSSNTPFAGKQASFFSDLLPSPDGNKFSMPQRRSNSFSVNNELKSPNSGFETAGFNRLAGNKVSTPRLDSTAPSDAGRLSVNALFEERYSNRRIHEPIVIDSDEDELSNAGNTSVCRGDESPIEVINDSLLVASSTSGSSSKLSRFKHHLEATVSSDDDDEDLMSSWTESFGSLGDQQKIGTKRRSCSAPFHKRRSLLNDSPKSASSTDDASELVEETDVYLESTDDERP